MTQKPLKTIAGASERPLKIGDMEIPCYVLEDETRVLSQRGLQSAVGLGTGGGRRQLGAPRMVEFMGSLEKRGVETKGLTARLSSPIEFQPPGGGRTAYGYPAEIINDVCDTVLAAREAGELQKQQGKVAKQCEILVRGLARVGIVALVDEVTGYQDIRAKNALANILEKYIAQELQSWTKTFPDEFYQNMFRLRGWAWKPWDVKRPSVIGRWTNDLVYERIAPGVLKELRSKNPALSGGHRKDRHHQWFTPRFGHPKLKEHLASVIALMRASSGWPQFIRNMNRAFPKLNETIEMPLDD